MEHVYALNEMNMKRNKRMKNANFLFSMKTPYQFSLFLYIQLVTFPHVHPLMALYIS